ncbi:MAG: membrane dipeptidase, partial [Candidatus Bathyarchaeia archaeon]
VAKKQYIQIWKKSGVTCMFRTLGHGQNILAGESGGVFKSIALYSYKVDLLKDIISKAVNVECIRRSKMEGKHCIIWNFNTPQALGGGVDVDEELDWLNWFYMCGIRMMGLTYNLRNFLGDGCTERYDSGLSYFGLRVVERMNELGIIIDTAHCGHKTTLDAVEASKDPVVASHTGCKSFYNHDRSKTDEEIKAIAESGGYIGIYTIPTFISEFGTIKEFLDQIDYAVDLVGADHVAIGTDNGYRTPQPKELTEIYRRSPAQPGVNFWSGFRPEHRTSLPEADEELRVGSLAWTNWPYFTAGLVSRGYSDQEIEMIIGGNCLRVLERVVG